MRAGGGRRLALDLVGIVVFYAFLFTAWYLLFVCCQRSVRRRHGTTGDQRPAPRATGATAEFEFGLPRPDDKPCSICLDDFGKGERCRILAACGHWFHSRCVDPWLRRSATCPVCRAGVVPSNAIEDVV